MLFALICMVYVGFDGVCLVVVIVKADGDESLTGTHLHTPPDTSTHNTTMQDAKHTACLGMHTYIVPRLVHVNSLHW